MNSRDLLEHCLDSSRHALSDAKEVSLHTCSRVFKNREGTINLFHLSIQKLKVPSISNVQCLWQQDGLGENGAMWSNTRGVGAQCTLEFIYTEKGTFNFWALEVTDLAESKLLLYFCRINWAQDRLLMDYRAPCSTSPVSQQLFLSSGLWTTAWGDHFRISREQYKKKSPESGWKHAQSLWFSKRKYGKSMRGPH